MKIISKLIILFQMALESSIDNFLSIFYKNLMICCGKNVSIKPSTSIFRGLNNLQIGNNVRIHRYATIFCTDSKLIIGNKVALGPKITIMTGNHNIKEVGQMMWDVKNKRPEDDKDVIIEDEIWIGANVTILSGAKISRGSVVGACSLVNKSFPPYSIIGGIPAKLIKYRFTVEQIIEHEKEIYSIENRLKFDDIVKQRENY